MRSSPLVTPTSSLTATLIGNIAATVAPFAGSLIFTVGGVGTLPPNVLTIASKLFIDEPPHWHARALYSPHGPAVFWKTFRDGPVSRYVIGSLLSYLWSRPHECAVSCATVQQMSSTLPW